MFDIGWSEFIVIAVVALIAIGPKELPGVLRSVGHWMGKIRQMAGEFQNQFNEAMREAEMADLKKHADDLSASAKSLTSGISSAFDSYDPLKETKTETPTPPATATPSPETTTAATGAAPLPAPPDFSQVAAMPDISSSPEPTVAPAPATPAPETAPPRREAS
jgi:sec-independent protein translocase protein TatB